MAFNWTRFLSAHRVDWTDSGPSTTADNIATRCPWCGNADPSHHLAISTEGKGYRCFRVKAHSGRSVPRLIQALIECSWDEALRLAGVERPTLTEYVDERDLGNHLAGLVNQSGTSTAIKPLRPLVEFRPLTNRGSGRHFVEYLEDRGYELEDIPQLQETYNLHYAIAGAFKWRLIFPITMRGVLVNWTGRAISKNAELRYRTLSANPEKAKDSGLPVAPLSIERTLFNYDNAAMGGEELMICEGPFDAMRLDYVGEHHGIRAVAIFTKDVSKEQITLLEGIRDLYDRFSLVVDTDAQLDVLAVQRRLAHLDCEIRRIPRTYKDPAEMPPNAALKFVMETLRQ